MFLEAIIKRNAKLIQFAKKSFFNKTLLPNTYILDLDTIIENAKKIKAEADKYNIELYQMTKQFGRIPFVAKEIVKAGIEKAVCVDFDESLILSSNNIKMGNIGHLVQIPNNLINHFLKLKPDVITVFGFEKAQIINKEAIKLNIKQNIILKVYDDKDNIYKGQAGGIHISKLKLEIIKIQKLKNLQIIGFTAFPTFLFNGKKTEKTNNLETVKKAMLIGQKMHLKISHINLPGSSSVETMKLIAKHKGTHAEPGHALMGTMPINAKQTMQETPAIIYVSEISHILNDNAYFYGGGHYRRSHFKNILVINKNEEQKFIINEQDPYSIDYYFEFQTKNKKANVGDLVIGSFRTQLFVTRAKIMVVKGLSKNKPKIVGVFSSQGEKIKWI